MHRKVRQLFSSELEAFPDTFAKLFKCIATLVSLYF